jgi:hypothetical protein
MVMIFDTQRRLGQEGELYFIFDADDTVGLYKQRAMLCRFANADPLQYRYFDRTTSSFLLKEIGKITNEKAGKFRSNYRVIIKTKTVDH